MNEKDTATLAQEVIAGDATARETFLERLRPRLILWAAAHMGRDLKTKLDPEDIAQETLFALHRDLPGVKAETARDLYAWIFTVAANRVRDAAGREAAQKRQEVPLPARAADSPSGAAMRSEALARLRAAIAALPTDYRNVIRLRRIEELPVADVAKHMGRSEGATRVLYYRALQALRDRLPDSDCDPAKIA